MATSITELASELQEMTAWQKTPVELTLEDYEKLIVNGIRKLYVDTGRASMFNISMVHEATEEDDVEGVVFTTDLPLDEREYVKLVAQIAFFKRVSTDVNNIVGYTTDAITITNADKPYANLKATIDDLERERRIVYYKMARYALLQ